MTLLRAVAVPDFYAIFRAAKQLADIFGDHHGAVLASGAAKGDGQIAFAFMNVVRQEIDEQVGDARNELAALRERPDIFSHARIASGERTKFGNEMRIGQKANVENQIGIFGHAFAKAEAHT